MNREEKMKIVVNNYFKKECSVNTSIREAFEKGFRIGASKVQKKHGHWILLDECANSGYYCSECSKRVIREGWSKTVKSINYCPNCGADMREVQDE